MDDPPASVNLKPAIPDIAIKPNARFVRPIEPNVTNIPAPPDKDYKIVVVNH